MKRFQLIFYSLLFLSCLISCKKKECESPQDPDLRFKLISLTGKAYQFGRDSVEVTNEKDENELFLAGYNSKDSIFTVRFFLGPSSYGVNDSAFYYIKYLDNNDSTHIDSMEVFFVPVKNDCPGSFPEQFSLYYNDSLYYSGAFQFITYSLQTK